MVVKVVRDKDRFRSVGRIRGKDGVTSNVFVRGVCPEDGDEE